MDSNTISAFDNKTLTVYESSNASCYLQLDLTSTDDLEAMVTEVQVYPDYKILRPVEFFEGATIEYSSDGSIWQTLWTIDSSFHSGWNSHKPASPIYTRFVKFVHDSTSKCGLSELNVLGSILSKTASSTLGDVVCSLKMNSQADSSTLAHSITYKPDSTPIVTSFSPKFGSIAGSTVLTITG